MATTIPPAGEIETARLVRAHAHSYIRGGWAVLLLGVDSSGRKIPTANCPRCDTRRPDFVAHDRESCECLTCHGFYAATRDPDRFDRMLARLPGGALAVRTGRASRLLVVDAEAYAQAGEQLTGLQTLERWEEAVGGWSLPATLTARSISGGLHLFYRLPAGSDVRITSGRVLDGVDVKAEAGYVGAVSGTNDRRWVDVGVPVADAPAELLDWLGGSRRRGLGGGRSGSGSGSGGRRAPGYDFVRFRRDGCPGGHRDVFVNDVLFRARKSGATMDEMYELAWYHWERFAQPPDARWYMPWEHVAPKVPHVYRSVEPDELPRAQRGWLAAVTAPPAAGEVRRVGAVTLVGRGRNA